MDPLVRDLYKRFLVVGRHYPQGLNALREKIKKEFLCNRELSDPIEIKKRVAKGRYWVREVSAINALHKYRQMKKRYDPE
jgi:hypothetical protein